ncbi:hypothetical protein [Mariniflexile sp. HMF6888]|uniref:hypothetical protein n=1 Tax=Mariniflexile sp. HMF6888 TaxID=3373086 RepID=UPI0037B7DE88
MNKLIYILVIVLAFVSCNGKTKKDTLKTSVEKFKDSLGTLEIEKYIPETYSETVTDTILSNGFKVKVKTFTDMKHSVLNIFKQDTIVYKHYYRELASQVTINKDGNEILKLLVDKNFIIEHDAAFEFNKEFYNESAFYSIWFSELNSTIYDHVVFIVSICKPESDDCLMFEITIDMKGNYQVKEFEYNKI